jgi:amino acid transporter
MSSFQTYLFGFIVLIIGLALAAYLLNVPPVWIAVAVVILIGIGIISASTYNDTGNPPPPR